jgi:hypothetical protein
VLTIRASVITEMLNLLGRTTSWHSAQVSPGVLLRLIAGLGGHMMCAVDIAASAHSTASWQGDPFDDP